ncbi:hypothetical protein EIN_273710 [Entamoeba invadens IP1]|uniref:Uncharacterized protein n=1 Tax=Entamoeba invadens IP1 TaxID=370355 RepID=A0A0A1U1B0_ENTIV|nr:hypothetical protein EIN_273710 [Entamoeba invadens IP1]ELP87834.1 hypothetical protein EIN_273710 [Entamoeba invadens IP1]|eukprot:XP_004254605.1 hypothetical protein EIN_273710 [Entamoeba invadens IP1]
MLELDLDYYRLKLQVLGNLAYLVNMQKSATFLKAHSRFTDFIFTLETILDPEIKRDKLKSAHILPKLQNMNDGLNPDVPELQSYSHRLSKQELNEHPDLLQKPEKHPKEHRDPVVRDKFLPLSQRGREIPHEKVDKFQSTVKIKPRKNSKPQMTAQRKGEGHKKEEETQDQNKLTTSVPNLQQQLEALKLKEGEVNQQIEQDKDKKVEQNVMPQSTENDENDDTQTSPLKRTVTLADLTRIDGNEQNKDDQRSKNPLERRDSFGETFKITQTPQVIKIDKQRPNTPIVGVPITPKEIQVKYKTYPEKRGDKLSLSGYQDEKAKSNEKDSSDVNQKGEDETTNTDIWQRRSSFKVPSQTVEEHRQRASSLKTPKEFERDQMRRHSLSLETQKEKPKQRGSIKKLKRVFSFSKQKGNKEDKKEKSDDEW